MAAKRVGIIGSGAGDLLSHLLEIPDLEVVGCHGTGSRFLAGVKTFESADALFHEVDAVVVDGSPAVSSRAATEALNRGLDVLLGSPFAPDLKECWRLNDAAHRSHGQLLFGERACFSGQVREARRLAREGDLGQVVMAQGRFSFDLSQQLEENEGIPSWRQFWLAGRRGALWLTPILGPAMQFMLEQNQHDRAKTVTCFGSGAVSHPQHQQDDSTLVVVQMESGRLIQLQVDLMSPRPDGLFLEVQGVYGGCRFELDPVAGLEIWRSDEPGTAEWEVDSPEEVEREMGASLMVREFADMILSGQPHELDVYAALEWTAVSLCSQISIESGSVPVKIPDFRRPGDRPAWIDGEDF